MREIKQRKGLETRKYSIRDEFVEVEYNTLREKLKYKIQLTEIGNEIEYEADNTILGKIMFAITALITSTCLILYLISYSEDPGTFALNAMIWGILSTFFILKPNKDDIIITNGNKVIRLFRNKPNEKEVLDFANNLIEISNTKKKEMLINFELSQDQFLENIDWLLHIKMIDQQEYENLRVEFEIKKLL